MTKKRLRIPKTLAAAVVAVGLSSCGSDPQVPQSSQALCPSDWFCTSDAARAFNCTDMSSDPFQSDLGSCSPPI
jgi:hypothetical protein